MKTDRALLVLVIAVLAAAAIIYAMKRSPESPEPVVAEDRAGDLELVVVGIEGLEPSIVERLAAEGRMPVMADLMERGAAIEFTNLGNDIGSEISWACVAAGAVPVAKPIGWTKEAEPGDKYPFAMRPTALWTVASDEGKSVAVVGWPGTWPVADVNGIMVGPYSPYVLAREHGDDTTPGVSPVSLLDEIDPLMITWKRIPRRSLAEFFRQDASLGFEALIGYNYKVLQKALGGDRSMLDVSRYSVTQAGDQLFVFLPGLNDVSQRFWHYYEPDVRDRSLEIVGDPEYFALLAEALSITIDRYYEYIDGVIGTLLSWAAEDATVAVVSDHGISGVSFDANGHPRIGVEMYSDRGLCVIAGPRVAGGERTADAAIHDIAPTIAEAAGLPVPPQAEGTARQAVLVSPR